MHTFKRKTSSRAVLATLAIAAADANAVYEDPHGVGQVLIYPYYTVQSAGGNSFNTYLSVANTSARAKALKVRFREGKNSREVLAFNLYLSPNDVWTAALGPDDATPLSPARMITRDKSCTAPPIPVEGVTFRNYAYTGASGDLGPTGLDRTREGYFEIIEMATLVPGSAAAAGVAHDANGTPFNCATVQPDAGFSSGGNAASLAPPTGGLVGTYTLINVANGLNFGGNATALAQFSSGAIFGDLGTDTPNLGSANPPTAMMVMPNSNGSSGYGTTVYVATYGSGRDAVSAALTRASISNEYVLDVATRSSTDWVVTFPTKALYVAPGSGSAIPPFARNFGTTGSCEQYTFTFFSREEAMVPQPTVNFPEAPPPGPNELLCWAAQVISPTPAVPVGAATSSVFGSANFVFAAVNNFQNGWSSLSFPSPGAVAGISSLSGTGTVVNADTGASRTGATVTARGLPAIGFMARTLNNGALSCTTFGGSPGTCAGAYGAAFDHRYRAVIEPSP